jgi:LPXTG-motif cell wall-anchored protein
MSEQTVIRRRLAVAFAVTAGAIGLMAAFPAGAADNPEGVDGNPTCGDLAPEGVEWTEFKVEPVEDGTFSDGTLTVTIDVHATDDGPTFDWTSNIGVDAVFVKGGPNGTLYLYDPPAESTGDTGLHAPVNPNNDKFFGLSHISFCYDEDQATTSTTAEETTSTTVEETTSTTVEETTSTTAEETTSTTAEETSTTAVSPSTTTPGGQLPRTGSSVSPMLGIGAALLIGGGFLLAYARRFRSS